MRINNQTKLQNWNTVLYNSIDFWLVKIPQAIAFSPNQYCKCFERNIKCFESMAGKY